MSLAGGEVVVVVAESREEAWRVVIRCGGRRHVMLGRAGCTRLESGLVEVVKAALARGRVKFVEGDDARDREGTALGHKMVAIVVYRAPMLPTCKGPAYKYTAATESGPEELADTSQTPPQPPQCTDHSSPTYMFPHIPPLSHPLSSSSYLPCCEAAAHA